MRVLVTGGAGFIGSHIVDALRERGDEAVVLDNFASGVAENLAPGIETVRVDIAAPVTAEVIARAKPEAIIHAAAQASVPRSMADPARDRAINLLGTAHVIEGARLAGGCRVVFLSTGGGIYGETAVPATEESLPKPKSFYSLHKYAAETYLTLSGLPFAIARLANVYGPRQQSHLEGGVVAIFAERLASGASITIFGSGEQERDLVHVRDVSAAVLAMLDADTDGLWNVGTGTATTVNALLALMAGIIGPAGEVRREAARAGDVFRSCLSAEKIAAELGWRPGISLAEGIASLSADGRSRE